ncbi:MAG TPA: hypothetical protein VMI72_15815 [Roseiarcus sp.]|nr:hypothetical protein [Roseiarcus sp.]
MMKLRKIAATRRRGIGACMLLAVLAHGPIVPARADGAPAAGARSADAVAFFAMRWFTEIQAGRTDRSLYAPGFVAEVTDAAIAAMSRDLNRYGAGPLRAEIVRTGKDGGQTFYTMKFVFPRGDATSLIFGFDPAGKITAIAPAGMAGD